MNLPETHRIRFYKGERAHKVIQESSLPPRTRMLLGSDKTHRIVLEDKGVDTPIQVRFRLEGSPIAISLADIQEIQFCIVTKDIRIAGAKYNYQHQHGIITLDEMLVPYTENELQELDVITAEPRGWPHLYKRSAKDQTQDLAVEPSEGPSEGNVTTSVSEATATSSPSVAEPEPPSTATSSPSVTEPEPPSKAPRKSRKTPIPKPQQMALPTTIPIRTGPATDAEKALAYDALVAGLKTLEGYATECMAWGKKMEISVEMVTAWDSSQWQLEPDRETGRPTIKNFHAFVKGMKFTINDEKAAKHLPDGSFTWIAID